MLTDIEIAQNADIKPISEIASELGIDEKYIEQYGHYKAKISEEYINKVSENEDGKLILVTRRLPEKEKQL